MIRWSTLKAMRLLVSLVGAGAAQARLPQAAAQQLLAAVTATGANPVLLERDAGNASLEFNFVGEAGGDDLLFRVGTHDPRRSDEVLAQRFALTAREAEVLLWIARGKANRDIGEILALSPRTVNKHLETIFTKLGVENRASAAVLASRVLDER